MSDAAGPGPSAETETETDAEIVLAEVDPDDPRAAWCLGQYLAEIDARFDVGYDPAAAVPTTPADMRPPKGLFVLATQDGEPVGCGALKLHGDGTAEVKRVWTSAVVRGRGLGRRLLRDLESRAVASGRTVLRLDTNAALVEAMALYRSEGWVEVPRFNDERYADHWFEKHVPARP
ncbi:acetyltransferase (GNAT) family protein [Frigoribacterium sp. PhB160]|uniref:GNAT family N-acetyltransferase n=1 Tax=Frigoribacterium sp. PhB160 TaxID=2485192 RepID=UPI000F46D196|nr:GNAT family N-acetyltransferase [Frigoribacterium sp. PhB160]ROS61032.1 acetyltransferase (GNAT) family protein [Frigoribacterium sp. PhB160]